MRVEIDEHGNKKIVRSEHVDEPDRSKKTINKFYSIPHLSSRYLNTFRPDEYVWIEEKIDGSNISCEIDDNNMYRCFGGNYELGTWYTNRGAYEKLLEIEDKVREVIGDKYTLYFESLSLHHVRYSSDKEDGIYLIGIKDKATDLYLTPDKVYDIANKIGVETPVCLYKGYFKDWSVAEELVGKSGFGAVKGEGVIVKAYDKVNGIKMIKLVAEDFREIMKYDPSRVQAKVDDARNKKEKAKEIVTEARIRKQLYRLLDEGTISSVDDMTKEDKVLAIKYIGKLIYDDCVKEETEFIVSFGKDFGKYSYLISREYIEKLFIKENDINGI